MVYDPADPTTHPAAAGRIVPPSLVSGVFQQWEQWIAPKRLEYREVTALWRTEFWREAGYGDGRFSYLDPNGMIRVEVNRIYGFVVSLLAALFPDGLKVKLRGGHGHGDRKKAQAYLNDLIENRALVARAIFALQQAITFDGAGLKVSVDHDEDNPEEKVKVRTIPWWEIVPDRDAQDWDDQRFVMHCYWVPHAVAVRRFNDPKIVSTHRPDPLDKNAPSAFANPHDGVTTNAFNQDFVRILEVYNFVDPFWLGEADPLNGAPMPVGWEPVIDEMGHPVCAKGRYEVYLPDQPGGTTVPRQVMPMPYANRYGKPSLVIHPLMLNSELEYPFRGLSTVGRVKHQFFEKILGRTFKANAVKRNSRQLAIDETWVTDKFSQGYAEGQDGAVLKYKRPDNDNRNIREVMVAVPVNQLSPDNDRYEQEVDADIALGGAPARGNEPIDTSATQYIGIEDHQRTQIGLLTLRRDIWLASVVQSILVAQVAALRACGPSAVVQVDVMDDTLDVTADDLDAVFKIKVESGPATLSAEERRKRELVSVLPLLAEFLKGVRTGDAISKVILDYLVEKFDFPPEFLSKHLEKLLADMPAPPTDVPEVGRQPGAGSALPGAGSSATPDMGRPRAEGAGGMRGAAPMPQPQQPPQTTSGQAQNIHGAGTAPSPT